MRVLATIAVLYTASVVNNVWTKRVMAMGFRFPMLLSCLGLVSQIATLSAARLASPSGKKRERESSKPRGGAAECPSVAMLLPVSLATIAANMFHRVALMHTTIPVVHTVKSATVVATAALAYVVRRELWPSTTGVALVIFGIATAMLSMTESSALNAEGISACLICVAAASFRAVCGKSVLSAHPGALPKMQLLSLALFTPVALVIEGQRLLDYASAGGQFPLVDISLALLGVTFMELGDMYLLMLLDPTTHSIANGLRSLVLVSIGSILDDGAVSMYFLAGSFTAILGVFVHSAAAHRQKAKIH
ncbi:hypothetical protein DIPPA_27593 [Diplonema papillatum]|nr:hypothetical protein DIPPA_27593 [Diplonema papillatum]